jgi:pyranose oxidase
VDVLIVGSGPLGATFARVISEGAPRAKIMMVEVGPQIAKRPGMHVRNITDPEERVRAQIRSQGPAQYPYAIPSIEERAEAGSSASTQYLNFRQRAGFLARPGTFLAEPDVTGYEEDKMPAAACSSNVGGMGAHWTGACPQPGNTERIPFISDEEWARISGRAAKLLHVTTDVYPETPETFLIHKTLGQTFDHLLPEGRKVQLLPLAVQVLGPGKYYWTAPDVILGPLADQANDGSGQFTLRSETICRRVLTENGRVTGAVVEHLPTGKQETIAARFVVVAADSLRTPQVLWASGVRPRALGHYLNDQPQILSAVELDEAALADARETLRAQGRLRKREYGPGEEIASGFFVPFHYPTHPFHAQVMHSDISPIQLDPNAARGDPKHVVILSWFTTKDIRYDDYIEFSDTETDSYGMPKMTIHYELTAKDKENLARALELQGRASAAFGHVLEEDEAKVLPAGSSLHYQGTVRMGERDDGTSVCDPYSQVWGVRNLYVGSNGVIPTATACNPTFTSVSLAVRAAEKIASLLQEGKSS